MSGRHLVDNATHLETSDFSAYIVKNIQINLYSMTEINNGTFIFYWQIHLKLSLTNFIKDFLIVLLLQTKFSIQSIYLLEDSAKSLFSKK